MARKSQSKGQVGETIALYALKAIPWLEGIERIHTGWRLIRVVRRRPLTALIAPMEKLDGDFRGIDVRTGRSVLVEVKAREDKLSLSDFEPHQRDYLTRHRQFGGESLVVWVDRDNVHLLPWPVDGLKRGTRLDTISARQISDTYKHKEDI